MFWYFFSLLLWSFMSKVTKNLPQVLQCCSACDASCVRPIWDRIAPCRTNSRKHDGQWNHFQVNLIMKHLKKQSVCAFTGWRCLMMVENVHLLRPFRISKPPTWRTWRLLFKRKNVFHIFPRIKEQFSKFQFRSDASLLLKAWTPHEYLHKANIFQKQTSSKASWNHELLIYTDFKKMLKINPHSKAYSCHCPSLVPTLHRQMTKRREFTHRLQLSCSSFHKRSKYCSTVLGSWTQRSTPKKVRSREEKWPKGTFGLMHQNFGLTISFGFLDLKSST